MSRIDILCKLSVSICIVGDCVSVTSPYLLGYNEENVGLIDSVDTEVSRYSKSFIRCIAELVFKQCFL